jgi:hypothetical protein
MMLTVGLLTNLEGTKVAALAGHAIDVWRFLRFDYGNPHSLSKFRNLVSVAKKTGARQFIETGTYLGRTTRWAASRFEHVVTIELDPKLAARAAKSLADLRNVEVIEGDAVERLREVMARPAVRDALVYLDGHFSGGVTARGRTDEPACEGLEVLVPHIDKVRGIVVDDFRTFGTEFPTPTKADLLGSAERHFGHQFDIHVHLDQVLLIRRP